MENKENTDVFSGKDLSRYSLDEVRERVEKLRDAGVDISEILVNPTLYGRDSEQISQIVKMLGENVDMDRVVEGIQIFGTNTGEDTLKKGGKK